MCAVNKTILTNIRKVLGVYVGGRGRGGLNCLCSLHYSRKLVTKAFSSFDPRVLQNCKEKAALGFARDAGIVALLISGFKDIVESVKYNAVSMWGMLGIGETSCLFLLVSAS